MTDWDKYLPRVNYLGHAEIERGAIEMAEFAAEHDVVAVLIGGSALHYFGSPRLTADVDFAATALIPAERTGRLSFGGEKLLSPGGIPVDWVVRDDDYADLYAAAIADSLPSENNPAPVDVARPEYVLVMKMVADRGKDRADVEWLLANNLVDIEFTRRIVRQYLGAYALRDLDALEREVAWKKSRGEL